MKIALSRHRVAFSLMAVVRTIFSFGELLLMVRIILDFLGASSDGFFVYTINKLTDPLLWPFVGTFPPYELNSGFVIQTYAVLAFAVYAFLGYLVTQGINAISTHRALWRKNIS